MAGKDLQVSIYDFWKLRFQSCRNARVQLLTATAKHASIGRILNQCMLERVHRIGRRASTEYEFRAHEVAKSILKAVLRQTGHRVQQLIGEITP